MLLFELTLTPVQQVYQYLEHQSRKPSWETVQMVMNENPNADYSGVMYRCHEIDISSIITLRDIPFRQSSEILSWSKTVAGAYKYSRNVRAPIVIFEQTGNGLDVDVMFPDYNERVEEIIAPSNQSTKVYGFLHQDQFFKSTRLDQFKAKVLRGNKPSVDPAADDAKADATDGFTKMRR